MCGLFTPLINRLALSQVLACPGHTCENQCEGRAGIDWFCGRRLRFPAWTLSSHCHLHT